MNGLLTGLPTASQPLGCPRSLTFNIMSLIKPSLLVATGLALALGSNASVGSAVDSRSPRAPLDAADAAQQETINLAVSGMT